MPKKVESKLCVSRVSLERRQFQQEWQGTHRFLGMEYESGEHLELQ